jgi:hypothetical protein
MDSEIQQMRQNKITTVMLATFRRKIDVLGIWPMPRRKANPVGKAGGVCKA